MDEIEKDVGKSTKKPKDCFNRFETLKLEDEALKKEIEKVQNGYSDLNKKFDDYQSKNKKEKIGLNYLLIGQSILVLILIIQAIIRR